MQSILVRADSSVDIGGGHAMRMMVLSKRLEALGYKMVFLCKRYPGNINQDIRDSGFELIEFDMDCKESTLLDHAVLTHNPVLLVVDHYEIDDIMEQYFIDRHQLRLMAYDDLYRTHKCELLVNPNIHAHEAAYEGKVPGNTKVLAGPEYAVLHDEFFARSQGNGASCGDSVRLLVTMGNSDPCNIICKILEGLGMYSDILELKVIAGPSNQYFDEISMLCNQFKDCVLLQKTGNMAECMQWASFAITAAGQTATEAIFMKLPTISVCIAENQRYVSEYLRNNNLSICLDRGFNEIELTSAVDALLARRSPSMEAIKYLSHRIGAGSVADEVHASLVSGTGR